MPFREEGGIKEDRQYYWGMIDLAKSMEIITWDEASKLYTLKEKFRKEEE